MTIIMTRWRKAVVTLALSVLLNACGESGEMSSVSTSDTSLAAAIPSAPDNIISGRVADGYINGATVCLDLDNSDSCGADEPSTITGSGGAYTLEIPANLQGVQVIADIPASAIDEDTGTAIGQNLLFAAPAERPEFISPITTLIQQEVRNNPALRIDEAEEAVKRELGIDTADGVSLFQDYVAEARDEQTDNEQVVQFRYLHETARVVASMMKDIETQVENAVQQSGADIAGNDSTRQAIRELVRTEVRQLLPQIAQQVSQIVVVDNPGSEASSQSTPSVDSDQIAQNLRPDGITENIDARIESIIESPEIKRVNMKEILAEGLYWIETDCDHDHPEWQVESVADQDELAEEPSSEADEAEYSPECHSAYGHAQLDDSGNTLMNTMYEYDVEGRGWIELRETDETQVSDYALVDGEWVGMQDVDPQGDISFADDGSATVINENGQITIKAVSQALDGVNVERYLWHSGENIVISDPDSNTTTLFNSGSYAFKLTVDQNPHTFVLFNNNSEYSSDAGSCPDYASNCNVIKGRTEDGLYTSINNLDAIREGSSTSIELAESSSMYNEHSPLVTLSSDLTSDGSLPVNGIASWLFSLHPAAEEIALAPDENCNAGYPSPGNEPDNNSVSNPSPEAQEVDDNENNPTPEGNSDFAPKPEGAYIPPRVPEIFQHLLPVENPATAGESDNPSAENYPNTNPDLYPEFCPEPGSVDNPGQYHLPTDTISSTWQVIQHDGVSMIEIALPVALRHQDDREGESALLLIEHDGFVRLGARINASSINTVITYNDPAFTTIKDLLSRAAASPMNQ